MKAKKNRARCLRVAAALAVGGSMFQLSGCDPAVRGALLTGLEETTSSLSGALISAFFISLEDDTGTASDSLSTT
ncbi:MAG: hypothetical protein AABZ47_08150 [Planctomycetota bacterium]